MINSRNPQFLTPDTRRKLDKFVELCKEVGIDPLITSTYRDNEAQAALYAQGRTAPGRKVTNAGPGHSWHNYRVAFDFVPLQNGKAIWDDDALWAACGVLAVQAGLEWGGNWVNFQDRPHCQNVQGHTIKDMLAGGIVLK